MVKQQVKIRLAGESALEGLRRDDFGVKLRSAATPVTMA